MATSVLDQLTARKEAISAELGKVEQNIYEQEGTYLAAEYSQCGTVLKARAPPDFAAAAPPPPPSLPAGRLEGRRTPGGGGA